MRFAVALISILMAPSLARGQSRPSTETFDVICRAGWKARKPTKPFVKHTIKRLTVHHSGSPLRDNRRAPGRIGGAQRYHQSRGWPDIAYHYLIDRAGTIYEGRPTWARGDTGTRYDTTGHFLVCVVGDYDKQQPRPAQVASLTNLLAWASAHFKVKPETIRGHKQVARTKCPGKNLQTLIADGSIERAVVRKVRAGIKLNLVCGDEARRRIRVIRHP